MSNIIINPPLCNYLKTTRMRKLAISSKMMKYIWKLYVLQWLYMNPGLLDALPGNEHVIITSASDWFALFIQFYAGIRVLPEYIEDNQHLKCMGQNWRLVKWFNENDFMQRLVYKNQPGIFIQKHSSLAWKPHGVWENDIFHVAILFL